MIRLKMLPAGHGDCLWLEYGDPAAPRRVLIDGGTAGTYKKALKPSLLKLPEDQRRFELMVVSHIDADHIAGALELFEDKKTGFSAGDIWFNGFRHLPDEDLDTLGPVQGEKLTDMLLQTGMVWNGAFKNEAVVVPQDGALPRIELEGGLVLTVLSPIPEGLANLKPKWEHEILKAGLDPNRERPGLTETDDGLQLLGGAPDVEELAMEPFSEDTSVSNESCIALLAEFEGRRLLLAGDAHASVIKTGLDRLGDDGKVNLDVCKMPHHGSKANISSGLLNTIKCNQYLFSSNGAYFKHPDKEAIARVIKWGGAEPQLVFNYHTKYNSMWDSAPLREEYGFKTRFPETGSNGIVLEWE